MGSNGFQDLSRYADGYAKATTALLEKVVESYKTATLEYNPYFTIYPVMFCARHAVELYLKAATVRLPDIRCSASIDEAKMAKTHDIQEIWNHFKTNAGGVDRRYLPIIEELEKYIDAFAAIDPTGQTFRYPYDNEGDLSLGSTRQLSIPRIQQSLSELLDIFNKLDALGKELIQEYKLGTYTKNLSRSDLQRIATMLPPRHGWDSEEFLPRKRCDKEGIWVEQQEVLCGDQSHRGA